MILQTVRAVQQAQAQQPGGDGTSAAALRAAFEAAAHFAPAILLLQNFEALSDAMAGAGTPGVPSFSQNKEPLAQ